MSKAGDGLIDLRAAAAQLGVHYQTAYGWVRTGRLRAELVAGRYMIARDALDAVVVQRSARHDPQPPGAKRLRHSAERMHEALLAGDEPAARRVALGLVNEGTSMVDVIQTVFVPSLIDIGQSWHDGRLTISVEHRASAIVERILGELAPNPRGRRRGTAVVAAISGDHHSLPTSMAAMALRDDNWHVEHLGANMPPDELVRFCAAHVVDLTVITSTNLDTAGAADDAAVALRAAGTPTIVGRPGRTLTDLVKLAREVSRNGHRETQRSS